MGSMNKVIIVGNLGKDPELKNLKGDLAVANFSVATTEYSKDDAGNKVENTTWHEIVTWNRQAETCAQFLKKGSSVLVEGKLQTRSWDDKEGNKKYKTEIIANNVQFLGKKESANNPGF